MENKTKSKKIKVTVKPYLEVTNLQGRRKKITIKKNNVIIGRLSGENDIVLEPDAQKLVTRYMHCSIEKKHAAYWLIDNASKNGTFIKRKGNVKQVQGSEKLQNHDSILILGKIETGRNHKYWEIKFIDPQATENANGIKIGQNLEYDWLQAKLLKISGTKSIEIKGLSPLEHSLIRFMDQRNKNNKNIPVMCTYDELMSAIWEEFSSTHTKNDVNRLIWGLRKKIEDDPQNPKFLQNIRGMGYRLVTNLSTR